ncbi:uncharacterized protein LOC134817171 [Bolinopsis microptera]|uniref:uncharacterized protein LOC134817171 n=1 Tax=Bolinopsis microptera TaxID=2820187 RepID=UPI003079B767
MPPKKAPPIKITKDYTFFYTAQTPFSQFYKCEFTEEGTTFCCAEQYMMYRKAKLFDDLEIANLILEETLPSKIKALGRRVEGFSDEVWIGQREIIAKQGNLLKFGQNADLKERLLETGTTSLVEASGGDVIWGIGLSIKNPAIDNKKNWKGLNLLGKILTQVRDEFKTKV